jgi:hypothetical protein
MEALVRDFSANRICVEIHQEVAPQTCIRLDADNYLVLGVVELVGSSTVGFHISIEVEHTLDLRRLREVLGGSWESFVM